jgi:hypothetical protein
MALNPNRVYGFKTRTNQALTAACRFEQGESSVNRGLTVKHWLCARQENVNDANDTRSVSRWTRAGRRLIEQKEGNDDQIEQ